MRVRIVWEWHKFLDTTNYNTAEVRTIILKCVLKKKYVTIQAGLNYFRIMSNGGFCISFLGRSFLQHLQNSFLVNDERNAQILFYVFISIYNSLHVSSTSCSSSGETNCINTASGNSQPILPSQSSSNLHTSQPPT